MPSPKRRHRMMTVLIALAMCMTGLTGALQASAAPLSQPPTEATAAELKRQALVMSMADDYIAALGESVYLLTRSGHLDARGRWLAMSFLRNGVGACIDIAAGPNPSVGMLDLLVLTALQSWAFETHWIPAGIGEAGRPAVERLKRAETEAWQTAERTLSAEQLVTLRGLVRGWIAEHPERTVVSLVRFEDFADERKLSALALRNQAHGLLREVGQATAAVEDARLLGERLLWFAGRYPYLLGEQTELTAYRLIDQPEFAQLFAAARSAQQLSDTLTARVESLQSDLEQQQTTLFAKLATERSAAIDQLQGALQATVKDADNRVASQREETIRQFFDRLAQERTLLLDDISARQGELVGIMSELRQTITVTGTLAKDLTETVNAIDRVVSHFDADPAGKREPLQMSDVRDAAVETGKAADRVTHLLERAIVLLESNSWERTVNTLSDPAEAIVDRIFWRGVILIALLVAGLGLLRVIPQRIVAKGAPGGNS